MKKYVALGFLALMLGCGEGPPADLTPEKEAEMKAEMDKSMQEMMGTMQSQAPPGTMKPKEEKK